MTKEEAKKIIEYTFLNADGHLKPLDFDYGGGKGIVEALRMAIEELSKPPLPSTLDEAAEEYATTYFKDGRHIIDADRMFGFKAGAEWQKEQMIKDAIELPVKIDAGGYPYIQITGIEFFDYDKDKPTKKEGDVVRILILDEDD